MIRRVVKMRFRLDASEEFKRLFQDHKDLIRSFPGCEHLELWQGSEDECTFFTYSHWRDDADLQAYRESELFAEVWKQTKALFDARPEAWSTELVAEGNPSEL